MRDVARLAGVSHQTVSRVLNGHPNVRPETRTRVLDAMRALNYRRNLAARALVTRRSGTLGLIAFETTLFGPASTLYGIEQAAHAAGYFVSVASVRSLDRASVLEAVDRLCAQSVEGIVAIAPKSTVASALTQVPAGLPAVAVGGADGDAVPTVRIDNAAGAAMATRHLLALGHATVHHIPGPPDWPEARDRMDGWRDALSAAGAAVPVIRPEDWSARSGYRQGRALAADDSVTAIFCGNDQIALGALRALHEAGRRVPEQVSVVGFDDVPESPFYLPPLTTVRQDFVELGRRSLDLLLGQLSTGVRADRHLMLTPRLVTRASSGPAPARRG
ncbi:LacI family DNA-binding transcriptional regulator [Solwaraspora sp. WMMD1047]|nr:LacI family DNA-binding transcriptional regulator [Solwaraspora sp. WMMD1047]MDG4831348.1 LacI family DNA-binding transcriptional regulator [Solwaraspora sp. WMMD1047]